MTFDQGGHLHIQEVRLTPGKVERLQRTTGNSYFLFEGRMSFATAIRLSFATPGTLFRDLAANEVVAEIWNVTHDHEWGRYARSCFGSF